MGSLGFAGKIADKLIDSPVIPLVLITALLLGGYGLLVTQREDRPVVEVPMAVILIPFPGGEPDLIDQLIARPVSAWALQLERVEEVRSVSAVDAALISVEFATGVSDAEAFSELSELLNANLGELPAGTGQPVIETVGDERMISLMLTFSSQRIAHNDLRRLSEEVAVALEEVAGVRSVGIFGGMPRQVSVLPDPQALAAYRIPLLQLVEAIGASGLKLPSHEVRGDTTWDLRAGAVLRSVEDLRRIPVGKGAAGIVYLDDVASVEDGPAPAESHVLFWNHATGSEIPAISLGVTTVPRGNISDINRAVMEKLDTLHGLLIPAEVEIHIGYDAGRDATERVRNVLQNLLIATAVVIMVILAGLGLRAALAISIMIPATLSFVPIVFYLTGFTLNPVSIAAMILAIGIISDDSVIILENTARHFREQAKRSRELVVKAVDEVGNPTILAVILIIATILPTAFITGEMGQFVRAIPVGAAVAIFASLCLALTVIPYLALRLISTGKQAGDNSSDRLSRVYRTVLTPFMERPFLRWVLFGVMLVLLLGSASLVYFRAVQVGLTPYLDRETFLIEVQLPSGTPLERTLQATSEIGRELRNTPGIDGYTTFAGMAGPQIFPSPQPLEVRPRSTNRADIYVHLAHEDERGLVSYEIGQGLYKRLKEDLHPYDARMIIRRIPSGPANKEDIHAEIYGPTSQGRFRLADRVQKVIRDQQATSVASQSPEPANPVMSIAVDRLRASAYGILPAEVAQTFHAAMSGTTASVMHLPQERFPVPVVVRLSPEDRETPEHLKNLYMSRANGSMAPVSDIATFEVKDQLLDVHRFNLLPLVYVAAKLDKNIGEPMPVQQDVQAALRDLDPEWPRFSWFSRPTGQAEYTLHWGGEWEMTQQVYRDLGLSGLFVLILIYIILSAWFHSYKTPLIIMMPIPLIFIGVIPSHWILGRSLAGVGILGVITLAGIVVRNSVLLVDFVEQGLKKDMPLKEAIISAGVLRTRPIVLTAGTVMLGSGVLIFQPALEPLGLTLVSGVLVSTILTLLLIPVIYYHLNHSVEKKRRAAE